MNKPLSQKQKKAAALFAGGNLNNLEIAEKCGVSESTIVRWKRLESFQQAIADERAATARAQLEQLLPAEKGSDDLGFVTDVEREHLDKLDELIDKLSCLSLEIFDSCAAEDISPRALPALLKSLVGLIECRRAGADRITGLDLILDELSDAEKIFQEKIPPASDCG